VRPVLWAALRTIKDEPPSSSSSHKARPHSTTALMTQLQGRKLLLLLRWTREHTAPSAPTASRHEAFLLCVIDYFNVVRCSSMRHLRCSTALRQRRGPICSLINGWNANDPDSSCRLKMQRGGGRGGGAAFVGVGRACVAEPACVTVFFFFS